MRLVRFEESGSARWGVEQGEEIADLELGDGVFFPRVRHKSRVSLLPPCTPRQIICVALNYKSVAESLDLPLPQEPVFFLKGLGSLTGSGNTILLPPMSNDVVQEAELAIILKSDVNRAGIETAAQAIGGYTIANDVTARDIQTSGGNFMRAVASKSFETFFPCGPSIETDLPDLAVRRLECRINGDVCQSALLGDMIFPPAELVARLSQAMPLYRGDVIATGTPLGYAQINDGDTVEISIEGLEPLTNAVKRDGTDPK